MRGLRRLAKSTDANNFLTESTIGVHVAHFDAPWIVGCDTLEEAGLDDGGDSDATLPDLSLDPTEEPQLLSVINSSRVQARSFFVTVGPHALDGDGQPLRAGFARDDAGETAPCVTLVLTVAPRHVMDVCYLPGGAGEFGVHSDMKDVADDVAARVQEACCGAGGEAGRRPLVRLDDAALPRYRFPLRARESRRAVMSSEVAASDDGGDGDGDGGGNLAADDRAAFVCSQGMGGCFTHFMAGTRHALDFRCDVGTPVVAVADGVVSALQHANTASGIHVRNLFLWNSVTLRLDDGNFAEYVHIAAGSVVVAVGERVVAGQRLCDSGDVGFCPEAHLHFCVYASGDANAPTIPFALLSAGGGSSAYVPLAGDLCQPCRI